MRLFRRTRKPKQIVVNQVIISPGVNEETVAEFKRLMAFGKPLGEAGTRLMDSRASDENYMNWLHALGAAVQDMTIGLQRMVDAFDQARHKADDQS